MMTKTPSIRETMELLDEASLKDVATSVGNKLKAAGGNKKAQGTEDAKRLQKHLKRMYEKWLGQVGAEADEESLMKFLVSKVGFTAANARKIFDKSGVSDPTKANESVMEALKKTDLDKVLLSAAQFAFEYDLVKDPNEKDQVKRSDRSDGSFGGSTRSSGNRVRGRYNSDPISDLRTQADKADVSTKQDLMKQVYAAGLEDEHMMELAELIRKTKSFSDIKALKDSDDVIGMLSRLGYAYIRSQQKN